MRVLAVLVLAAPLSAQVSVRFVPEPMIVPTSVLSNAKDLGRWKISACNDGPLAVTIPWERIDQASGDIRFIDPDDAMIVLVGHQKRTAAAQAVRWGSILASGLSIGLAIASKANLRWSTALSIGASVAPAAVQVAQGQIPSIAPLDTGIKYPVTLEPGACITDKRFAAKMKNAHVVTATIQPLGSVPAMPPAPIRPSNARYELSAVVDLWRMAE